MKYKNPKLYEISPLEILEAVCVDGNEASLIPSCNSGPEAGAGGCSSGVAALGDCKEGSAAQTICNAGSGFN